jgi:hypothetical protein
MDPTIIKLVVHDLCRSFGVDNNTQDCEAGHKPARRQAVEFLKALRSGKLKVVETDAS